MARSRKMLYTGTNRFVAAIDPKTGEEAWRTKLPHSGGSVPTILVKDQHLFVGHAGYVYCLDRRFGEILWENGLPRMGFQTVVLAMEGAVGSDVGVAASAAQDAQRRRAATAGAASAS